MTTEENPPTAKYTYTLTVHGNSHDEIEAEILTQTRGGYLLDSDRYQRDAFEVWGARSVRTQEHANPEMTPERYEAELAAWWSARKARRA